MRGYELCLIFHPEINESDIDNLLNSLSELILRFQGSILKTEKWGKKNFKYPIKKQSKGSYCFLCYRGNKEIMREIERIVKFKESVLRYHTVRLDKNFTIEDTGDIEPDVAEKTEKTVESRIVEETPDAFKTNDNYDNETS